MVGLQAPTSLLAPSGYSIGSSKASPFHEHRRGLCDCRQQHRGNLPRSPTRCKPVEGIPADEWPTATPAATIGPFAHKTGPEELASACRVGRVWRSTNRPGCMGPLRRRSGPVAAVGFRPTGASQWDRPDPRLRGSGSGCVRSTRLEG
jgi:hypothetical protein